MSHRSLRTCRLEQGLTQTELAARAGVSRQLVAAVEAGRNTPSVDAALGLARALGMSVEALFGDDAPRDAAGAVGGHAPDGAAVRIGRVGDRLVTSELPDHGVSATGWGKPDGLVNGGLVRLFAGARPAATVIAGCDPALGLAEALLDRDGPRSLMTIPTATGTAVAALAAGGVHAAVVHNRDTDLPAKPGPIVRWHLARWQVGLGTPAPLRGAGLDALTARGTTIVQRDPAAASQQAFLRAVAAAGIAPPPGPIATGHIDAARTAALIGAAAVTTEAAARAFGLAFTALEDHTVEIWTAARWAHLPGVEALGEVLASAGFVQRIARLGGYDLTGCGTRLRDAA
jgi:DNA-binding XRE family transcriptional regulator